MRTRVYTATCSEKNLICEQIELYHKITQRTEKGHPRSESPTSVLSDLEQPSQPPPTQESVKSTIAGILSELKENIFMLKTPKTTLLPSPADGRARSNACDYDGEVNTNLPFPIPGLLQFASNPWLVKTLTQAINQQNKEKASEYLKVIAGFAGGVQILEIIWPHLNALVKLKLLNIPQDDSVAIAVSFSACLDIKSLSSVSYLCRQALEKLNPTVLLENTIGLKPMASKAKKQKHS